MLQWKSRYTALIVVALLIVVAAFGGAFDLGEVGEYFSRNITW
jgi:hypothetical protein